MQCLQPNFTTDGIRNFMAQEKQCKQPILIDGKNIFTYCFQSIQRLQPNFTTDGIKNVMVQQKQRKQLLLTDDKNIYTYCFQSMQRLQPNSKTYAIRNFMYTKHNGDNPKLRIFSFIPQRRPMQPNFINHTYQTKNQTNTTQTTKATTSMWASPLTQSLLLQLRQHKFWSIHIQISINFKKFIFNRFRIFHASPICAFRRSWKTCTWLDEQFRTFHQSLHESITHCVVTFLINLKITFVQVKSPGFWNNYYSVFSFSESHFLSELYIDFFFSRNSFAKKWTTTTKQQKKHKWKYTNTTTNKI